jgi:hypothetical protein
MSVESGKGRHLTVPPHTTHPSCGSAMGLRYEAASEDGGRSSGVGIQVLIPNRLKLLWSKAMVVSV